MKEVDRTQGNLIYGLSSNTENIEKGVGKLVAKIMDYRR